MKHFLTQARRIRLTDSPAGVAVAIAFAFSLSIGFLDVVLGMLTAPHALARLPLALAPLAMTTLTFSLFYVILWFLVISPIGSFFKLQVLPLAVSLALGLGTVFLVASLSGLMRFPLALNDVFILLLVLLFSLLTSVAGYLANKGFADEASYNNVIMFLSFLTPVVLAETAVLVWLHKYRLGPFFSVSALLVTTGFALLVLFTVWVGWRLGPRIGVAKWLAVCVTVVVLTPLVIWVGAKVWNPTLENRTDHQIKHVILITVDTLRADVLSAYDPEGVPTPHIDELARDGILFLEGQYQRLLGRSRLLLPS